MTNTYTAGIGTLGAKVDDLAAELHHMAKCNCHTWHQLTRKMDEFAMYAETLKLAQGVTE